MQPQKNFLKIKANVLCVLCLLQNVLSTINVFHFVKTKVAHKGLIMSINLSKVEKISQ